MSRWMSPQRWLKVLEDAEEVKKELKDWIESISCREAEDWSGEPSVFFRVVLKDNLIYDMTTINEKHPKRLDFFPSSEVEQIRRRLYGIDIDGHDTSYINFTSEHEEKEIKKGEDKKRGKTS